VRSHLPKLLTGRDLAGFEERRDSYSDLGVPAELAERVAAMVPTYSAFGIVQAAASAGRGIEETAEVYFDLADRLQIARLRDRITALPRDDRWSTMARAALRDDLYTAHASLTQDVLGVSGPEVAKNLEERLAAWASRNEAAVAMATQTLGEIWESERFTFTTLSVALRAIRTLVAASSLPELVGVTEAGGGGAGDDVNLGVGGFGGRVDRRELVGPVGVHRVVADLAGRGEQRGERGGHRDR
jgi:glutamate dehydrogenase